jgi:hypothetical protein
MVADGLGWNLQENARELLSVVEAKDSVLVLQYITNWRCARIGLFDSLS